MKYTIEGFNQEYAISLQKKIIDNDKEKIIKLDCIDLVILRWFVDFWNSGEIAKLEDEGVQYAWVNYQGVLKRMPILNFSKQALADRFKKMSILDILEQKVIKKGGTFSCYKFGKNFKKLICSDIDGKCSDTKGVSSELRNGIVVNYETKESSIINNILSEKEYTPYNPPKGERENQSTPEKESKNLSTSDEDEQNEIDEYNFKIFWDAYPRKEGRTKAFGYFKQWVRGRKINGKTIKLTDMQIYDAVIAYAKEKKYTETKYIQQGSTFFNTTILDYVDME